MDSERPLHFPNAVLSYRLNSPRYTGALVGDFFEVLSLEILGGQRIHGDGSADGIFPQSTRLRSVRLQYFGETFQTGVFTICDLRNFSDAETKDVIVFNMHGKAFKIKDD